jgi:phosphatidylinositol alpha-1,6-mannosyltransferase
MDIVERLQRRGARVLLITDRYAPEVGGSIVWFENVYRRYPQGTVAIVTQAYPDDDRIDEATPGVRVYRTRLRRYRFLKPESLLLYAKLFFWSAFAILRHRVQVIYAGKVLPEGLIARLCGKLFRIPYVVYAHGEEITVFGRNPKLRRHLPRVYGGAARVIVNSDFTRRELEELCGATVRAVKISPGVDERVFRAGPRDAAIVSHLRLEGKIVLLSVGRLQKRKGHDHILLALPGILRQVPDLAYVILSTGEEEARLKDLARDLGIADHVRFVGEVAFQGLPRYYNTADIFILANRQLEDGDVEGFGIVFLEASACKRPVIAGASGGTGDAVREGVSGYRIDAANVAEIERAVVTLARDAKLREQFGEAGRQVVEGEYTWEKVVEKTLEVDAELVAQPGA